MVDVCLFVDTIETNRKHCTSAQTGDNKVSTLTFFSFMSLLAVLPFCLQKHLCTHLSLTRLNLRKEQFDRQTERERGGGDREMGRDIGIPANSKGIKPGVRLALLFRLDITKQETIWQRDRQLNHSLFAAATAVVLFVHYLS